MKKIYYIEKFDTLNKITHYYMFDEKLESWEYDKNVAIEKVSSSALTSYYNNSLEDFLLMMGYKNFELERIS